MSPGPSKRTNPGFLGSEAEAEPRRFVIADMEDWVLRPDGRQRETWTEVPGSYGARENDLPLPNSECCDQRRPESRRA
jgi:hypothetical protein